MKKYSIYFPLILSGLSFYSSEVKPSIAQPSGYFSPSQQNPLEFFATIALQDQKSRIARTLPKPIFLWDKELECNETIPTSDDEEAWEQFAKRVKITIIKS